MKLSKMGLWLVGGRRGPSGPTYSVSISGLTSNPTYGSTAQIGVELTASASGWSGDAPSSVAWQWYDGSGAISGATSATYTPVSGDDLEAIYATATPSDTYDPKNSAAYLVRYAPAINTVAPVASGDTSLGDTLTATNGTWTGATGGSYSYQWQRDGVNISGATASTYDIVAADDAADLRCVVTYTNSGGAPSANSNAVTVDDFAAPAITGSPTISGTEQVGQTLTATAASVTGNPTPSRTWQWVNSASGDISGATSSTYTLQASDEGDTITVRQTETNGIGNDTATSAATGAIAAAPAGATIDSVTVGSYSAGAMPVTIVATGATGTDTGYWVLTRAADVPADTPTGAAQVVAGDNSSDVAAVASGSFTWTGSPNVTLPSNIPRQSDYVLTVVNDNGALSNVESSAEFLLSTTAPTLSSPTATEDSGNIVWGVTSDLAFGTIYAAYRDSANGVLSATNIINTTGDAIATTTDASPTADANNGNTFSAPASGAYDVDIVQVDDFGNVSSVVSSAEVTVGGSTADAIISLLGSKLIGLWDPTDFANLKQDTAGSTAVTAATDPVRYITDLSGNGNHIKTSAGKNATAQSGYVDWNNADFRPASSFTGLTTGMEFYALIGVGIVADSEYVLVGDTSSAGRYTGHVQDGGSTAMGGGIGGTITFTVNNTVISPVNRDVFHDDMVTAAGSGYAVAGIQGANFSDISNTTMLVLCWWNGTISLASRVKYIVLTQGLTSGERSSLNTLLLAA